MTYFKVHAAALAVLACVGLTPGCYAHASMDAEYAEPAYIPPTVEVYPHYVYEGRTVYLIDDHWYTRHRGRWVYYRSEPEVLYRHRLTLRASPAHVHVAPPARRAAPAHVRVAPPAARVAPPVRRSAPATHIAPARRDDHRDRRHDDRDDRRDDRRDDDERRKRAPRHRD